MTKQGKEFVDQCILRMEENTPKIFTCLDELDENEIWKRPNEASNSIGNIILHLCGNIRQYAISSLGHLPDARERDKEFSAQGGLSKNELKEKLESTLKQAIEAIKNISEEELLKIRLVQGFSLSGIGIIIHVVEHYSYHTGQIVFWTKLLKNHGFDFYSNHDLNTKNQ